MESDVKKYAISIVWSDNDQGYIATCPEFPGLSAFGETSEVALAEARVAIPLFLATYEEEGLPVPEPQGIQHYSGQFRLRLPQSLHAQLARMADTDGVSLNQFILDALAERAGAQKIHKQMLQEVRRAIADLVVQNNYQLAPGWLDPKIDLKDVQFEHEVAVTSKISLRKTASNKRVERGQ